MSPLRGITLKVISVLVFIVMSSVIKGTDGRVPAGEVVFFRSLFAIPVILGWLAWRKELPQGLRAQDPMGHVWRGFAGTTAMGLGFAGLTLLPLPEVTALGYAAPLLTVVFAAMFLGEEVRAFRLMCVLLGMVGVMIVLAPRLTLTSDAAGSLEALGALLVLCGAVFSALAQVFVRKLVLTETTSSIVFRFSVTSTVLSLITIPFGWVWPSPGDVALLVGAGLMGGVGQIFLTASYRYAHASLVAPFEYASMLFSLVIGYLIFAEIPSLTMLSGAALIVTAGVLIIWRERRLGLERARPREAMTPQG